MFTLLLGLFVIGLIGGIWWVFVRGWIVPAAALLWILYAFYETWVQATCSGDCNIRVDLVLIWPLLLVVSLLAVGSLGLRAWRSRRAGPDGGSQGQR